MIEKEFLESIDYLMDLSERVKKTKKISPKLLSEIKCAKSYIDSLSSNNTDSYKLSEVSSMFDIIIISDAGKININNFDNPCLVKEEKSSVLDYIIDIIMCILDFVFLIVDSPIIFIMLPIVLTIALILSF